MIATYGNDDVFVYLKQIDATVASAIAERFDPNEITQFQKTAPSHDLWHLPIPAIPPLAPINVNVLRWPSDASRFATFYAIVTDTDLDTLSPICWSDEGPLPNNLTFTPDSPTETEGVTAVMLPLMPRPLTQIAGAIGLWLLPLVDARYFWWMVSTDFPLTTQFFGYVSYATNATPIVLTVANHGLTTGTVVTVTGVEGNTAANGNWSITIINVNDFSLNLSAGNGAYTSFGTVTYGRATSWASLILQIGAAVGATVTTSTIDASYGAPLGRMAAYRPPVPLYFDAVARTIGMRVVVGYDGSVQLQNWIDANESQTEDEELISTVVTRPGRSGGYFSDTIIEQVVPAAVDVAFLRSEGSGQYNEAPYVISESLSSLSLSQYGSSVGYFGAKTLFANLQAIYPGTITLTLGTQSSGTFTLSFVNNVGDSQTTSNLAYNCADTDIQAALVALSNIGPSNATVTGTGPFSISLANTLPGSSNGLQAAFGSLTTPTNASIQNPPSNLTALTNYATQAATDWYLYQVQDADLQFNGVVDWVPNGVVDLIEIWVTRDRCTTRISRQAYNELTWGCLQDLGFYLQETPFAGLTVEDGQLSGVPTNTFYYINTLQILYGTFTNPGTGVAVFTPQFASDTLPGIISTTTQTIKGNKTVDGSLTVEASGTVLLPLTAFSVFSGSSSLFTISTEGSPPSIIATIGNSSDFESNAGLVVYGTASFLTDVFLTYTTGMDEYQFTWSAVPISVYTDALEMHPALLTGGPSGLVGLFFDASTNGRLILSGTTTAKFSIVNGSSGPIDGASGTDPLGNVATGGIWTAVGSGGYSGTLGG
jgi:hypothetical protein